VEDAVAAREGALERGPVAERDKVVSHVGPALAQLS
jgi:hypothetical protein